MSDDRMRATGNAIANRTSAVWRASWLSLSVAPTTTKTVWPAFFTGTTSSRDESSPGGRRSTNPGFVSAARSAAEMSGAVATARVVSTIRPEGASTWAKASSGSIRRRRRPPPSEGSACTALAAITWARDCSPESTDARRSSRRLT